MATKTLNKKARTKTSVAGLLLMQLVGRVCRLQFERQDESFADFLQSSIDGEDWVCGASFKPHWVNAIEVNRDATYTICVRIPDDEYAEMVSDFEGEQGEISFFRG